MSAPVIMVVGTASSVGKSTLVTALCRIAARRGIRVAPFKAQNISNNAAVTLGGGEIARSTAAQAEAAGVVPTVEMNPILIKPEGGHYRQMIVEGRPWRAAESLDYWHAKQALWEVVTRNLDALRQRYDLVIAEGAGSPVELNLKAADIVNMRVATYAQARTLLVGDIDTGGIFAALLGTLMLLEPHERALIQGLVVNRFRGDPALFDDGINILRERSHIPVLGVLPWLSDLRIAQEDAVVLERRPAPTHAADLVIAVVQLPSIANFDDFDALAHEPGVAIRYVTDPAQITDAAAVILPGTKHTLSALHWLRSQKFDRALSTYKGRIVGICGGYQLLGQYIRDPDAIEGDGGEAAGLGLLPVTTIFEANKRTIQVRAQSCFSWAEDVALNGYEIHMGRTQRRADASPALRVFDQDRQSHEDGCVSPDGRVWGCYLHGLFANHLFRRAWLGSLGWQKPAHVPTFDPYEQLADIVEAHLDPQQLAGLLAH